MNKAQGARTPTRIAKTGPLRVAGAMSGTSLDGVDIAVIDTAMIDQAHAVLDTGAAVGDLAEIVPANLLLVADAERAVIGGDHVQGRIAQPAP